MDSVFYGAKSGDVVKTQGIFKQFDDAELEFLCQGTNNNDVTRFDVYYLGLKVGVFSYKQSTGASTFTEFKAGDPK